MLREVHRYHIELKLLSGMHISGSDDNFDIGGPDSQVIKNPITGEPYIPGSSLKGKLRSLLDYKYGQKYDTGSRNPELKYDYGIQEDNENKLALALFEPTNQCEPYITRGIFRDLVLTTDTKKTLEIYLGEGIYTEIKAENKINRFKGKAENPRFIERVPAGCSFEGEIDILEFEGDDYQTISQYLKEALELLKYNFIGGSGSRGYGRVEVTYDEIGD